MRIAETVLSAASAVACVWLAEGRAAIRQHDRVEITHMRIADGRGHAAIGDDATDDECFNARLAQNPFEPRHVKGRIGDLLDQHVRGGERIDQRLSPGSGREIALLQEGPATA